MSRRLAYATAKRCAMHCVAGDPRRSSHPSSAVTNAIEDTGAGAGTGRSTHVSPWSLERKRRFSSVTAQTTDGDGADRAETLGKLMPAGAAGPGVVAAVGDAA